MLDKLKKLLRINRNVIKGEVEEIKQLKPTEEDIKQGEVLADAAIIVISSMGMSYTVTMQKIIAKVFAYGIRDIKDGVQDNKKLIIGRVIEEIKNERTKEQETSDRNV